MNSLLLFLSGFAALVYQVLWMRDLSILFGNSADAAAVNLAVFFGGIALGAALLGRASRRLRDPLRAYGILELAIAASALLFFALLDVYGWMYAPLHRQLSESTTLLLAVKCLLAFGVLGLPTIFMGGTLPVMVQHASGVPGTAVTRSSAWLYGINTAGATLGAFVAGFFLPPLLGFRGSYLLAVGVNVAVGIAALVLARRPAPRAQDTNVPEGRSPRPARTRAAAPGVDPGMSASTTAVLACASGLLTIGLEVLWIRMFAQVLDHSVYAYAAIVVVALVAFALASLVVSRLPARTLTSGWVAIVLVASAAGAAAQPPLFVAYTDDLAQVQSQSGWFGYVIEVFTLSGAFVGTLGFVAGLVFPALLRMARSDGAAGAVVGRLVFLNTAGAIVGSLATGFLLLPVAGLWGTFGIVTLAYASAATWVAVQQDVVRRTRSAVVAVALASAVLVVASPVFPRVRLDRDRDERVLALWEGSHGIVAVTEGRNGRVLRMNNSYSLGGTVDRIERERIQTLIPLVLHPRPADVFFLGLGTGITAGEALRHPVERVVVCELVPEVVTASREHFAEWTRGLAADPRVEIRVEDGRQYLATTDDRFDVIVSDLFVPWHAGTGALYTREHFETIRSRLKPGAIFAQWLPLFQLGSRDFGVIARTMLEVFPHVVVWRGDFLANRPIVGLVASETPMAIDPAAVAARAGDLASGFPERLVPAALLPYYAGNIGEARAVLGDGAINTDERPVIEYLSPVTQWESAQGGGNGWFVGLPLVRFLEKVREAAPPSRDPYLARLSGEERGYVEAGLFYQRAIVLSLRDDEGPAQQALAEALSRLPADLPVSGPFMALDRLAQ